MQPSFALAEVTYASQRRHKTRQVVVVVFFFVRLVVSVCLFVFFSNQNIFTEKKKVKEGSER